MNTIKNIMSLIQMMPHTFKFKFLNLFVVIVLASFIEVIALIMIPSYLSMMIDLEIKSGSIINDIFNKVAFS